jgi:hypothetical protein
MIRAGMRVRARFPISYRKEKKTIPLWLDGSRSGEEGEADAGSASENPRIAHPNWLSVVAGKLRGEAADAAPRSAQLQRAREPAARGAGELFLASRLEHSIEDVT